MKKISNYIWTAVACAVGCMVGNAVLQPPKKQHLCECKLCKTKRQIETCDLLERIVLKSNKENKE